MVVQSELRLNLGAGDKPLPGYIPVDRKLGTEVYPLAYADDSVTEVRASHVLEHFSHRDLTRVVQEWVRVLKPGGLLKIAVPDFEKIARGYLDGGKENWGGYVMGGHDDADDFHRAIIDEPFLRALMEGAGLKEIQSWKSEIDDCASLPVSLNLQGRKWAVADRRLPNMKIIMTMPRLGFADNMFSAIQVSAALGIPFTKTTGAFWGQCLERGFQGALADGAEHIVTVDYDALFTVEDVLMLCDYMRENPKVDAICPVQIKRGEDNFLMGLLDDQGREYPKGTQLGLEHFAKPLTRLSWGHFGLTILKASAVKALPKPWIWSEPNKQGEWDEGRIDDDIYFWRKWHEAGNTLYMANRVHIGHAQLMATWASDIGKPIHQYIEQWSKNGKPRGVWR